MVSNRSGLVQRRDVPIFCIMHETTESEAGGPRKFVPCRHAALNVSWSQFLAVLFAYGAVSLH